MVKGTLSYSTPKGSIGLSKKHGKVSSGKFPKYLVKEHFNQDPPDWKEIGEIATYDTVNKNIEVISGFTVPLDKYTKSHSALTIDDNFYFEAKFTPKISTSGESGVYMGSYKDERDTLRNIIGLRPIYDYIAPKWFNYIYIVVRYSDTTTDYKKMNYELMWGTEYLARVWYDGVNRIITVKIYKGTNFDVLYDENTLTLSSSKTFTTDNFGLQSYPFSAVGHYDMDFDDAILTIPGSQSITKSLIATRKDIGSIKGGKVSGSISYR